MVPSLLQSSDATDLPASRPCLPHRRAWGLKRDSWQSALRLSTSCNGARSWYGIFVAARTPSQIATAVANAVATAVQGPLDNRSLWYYGPGGGR